MAVRHWWRKFQEDTRSWEDPCSWFDWTNIVKMPKLLKSVFSFNTVLLKVPMSVLTELGKKTIPNIHVDKQETSCKQHNPERNEQCGGITIPYLKPFHVDTVLTKKHSCRQWNRIEDPEMSACCNSHPIFGRDIKRTLEKRQLLQMVLRKLVSHVETWKPLCSYISTMGTRDVKHTVHRLWGIWWPRGQQTSMLHNSMESSGSAALRHIHCGYGNWWAILHEFQTACCSLTWPLTHV